MLHGRLFWSSDERFLKQFRGGGLDTRFKPYSKFPPCFKDVSFWTSPEFSENNLCEVVRSVAGATLSHADSWSLAPAQAGGWKTLLCNHPFVAYVFG